MKKASLALAVLAASTSAAWAQSSVTLYGIMDAGIRYTSNANAGTSQRQLIPGGMSQSRLGINVTEDMGGGMKALANIDHRLNSDTGAASSTTDFWRQAWVGLQTNAGIVRLGRQYNVLFDAYPATLASYKYSPFAEIFKPELGMTLGARQDNMVKYSFASGGLSGSLQLSAGEATTNNKSAGGLLKYASGPFAVVGTYLGVTDTAGKKATATIVGATYTAGPAHWTVVYAANKFDTGSLLQASITGSLGANAGGAVYNALANDVSKRNMFQAGVSYQLTPQLNLGTSLYLVDQTPQTAGRAKSKLTLWSAVADYAFSKRTDAYLEADSSSFNSAGVARFGNGATKRTGVTLGLRHRF